MHEVQNVSEGLCLSKNSADFFVSHLPICLICFHLSDINTLTLLAFLVPSLLDDALHPQPPQLVTFPFHVSFNFESTI